MRCLLILRMQRRVELLLLRSLRILMQLAGIHGTLRFMKCLLRAFLLLRFYSAGRNRLLVLVKLAGVLPLLFRSRLRPGVGVAARVRPADSCLRLLRLEGERYRPAGLLSHGQKQFLEIGMLLVQEPHLLLLDEPAAGMTDAETEYTAELFRTLAGQHSLMVVEHDMGFVETIADRVTVLHQGQVLAEGSLREVQANEQVIEVYLGR